MDGAVDGAMNGAPDRALHEARSPAVDRALDRATRSAEQCRARGRAGALLMLSILLVAATLPRVFVICVTDDHHVSLEPIFEGDPCETEFIFGVRADASWPTVACTDMPAVQLSALGEASPEIVPGPLVLAWAPPPVHGVAMRTPGFARAAHAAAEAAPPERSASRALRSTVLLI